MTVADDAWSYTLEGECYGFPGKNLTNDITETATWEPPSTYFIRGRSGFYSESPEAAEEEMAPEFLSLDWLLDLHEETCKAGRQTMARKNHDYTNGSKDLFANFEGSSLFGIHPVHGILLRTTDKLKRIETFVSKGELAVAGEGVDDAIEDAINYLVLIKAYLRKVRGE